MNEPTWRRSSACESSSCVEVAHVGRVVLLRNSQQPDGPVVTFDRGEWAAFVAGVRRGEFDQ